MIVACDTCIVRGAVAISVSLLVTAGVGTAAAQCTSSWLGSPARTLPRTGAIRGFSLGFDGSIRRDDRVRVGPPANPGATDPTGRRVATWQPGGLSPLRISRDGHQKTIATHVDLQPKWRPDGGAIAFGQDMPNGIRLRIAEVATGFQVRPTDALMCPLGGPAWSPDSRLVAVISPTDGARCSSGESLVVLDAQTGNAVSRTGASGFPAGPVRWSADGRYVEADAAIGTVGMTLAPRSPATGEARTIADCSFVGWAPVGARFAASCNERLSMTDASTGARTDFAASTEGLDGRSVWSSDGSHLAVSTKHGFVIADSNGRSKLIPMGGCAGGIGAGFATSGRVLVQAFNSSAGA
jgi:hypothetical protein